MKWIFLALIVLLGSLPVLVACYSGSFIGWSRVGSGHYYLTAENGGLLFDDAKALKTYGRQIHIRELKYKKSSLCDNPLKAIAMSLLCLVPEKETGDNSLKLIHKEKGLVRALKPNQTYDLPEALRQSAKRLTRQETWQNREAFLQRIEQLQSIEGVSLSYTDKPILPASYLVKINFPLRIAPLTDTTSIYLMEQGLRERFAQEMKLLGITNYQIKEVLHEYATHDLDNNEHSKILLHPYYKQRAYIKGYRTNSFLMQIECDYACAKYIEALDVSDWLISPVSHNDFIAKFKSLVEQGGETFNPEFTIDRPFSRWLKKDEHAYYLKGYIELSEIPREPPNLVLHWKYDLKAALNRPYPAELAQPVPTN